MSPGLCDDVSMRDLRILDALLRDRSLTKTAQRLETTQPSLSKTLARLRVQFADPLFVRNGQQMEPTAKALDLAPQLRAVLDGADRLRATAIGFVPQHSERQFSLLVTDVSMVFLLPSLLKQLQCVAPRVKLRAVPLDARQFDTKLESAEADVAIGAFTTPAAHLRRQRLRVDTYASLVRKDHPDRAALSGLAVFRAARHVMVTASDTGHAAHSGAQRALAAAIDPNAVILRVPSFVAGVLAAAATDAVITVPEALVTHLASRLDLVAFQPPIDLPRIEIAQYWHERFHRDAANRWFRGIVADTFSKFQPESR